MVGPQRPVLGALPSWKQSGRVGAASYRLMFSAEEGKVAGTHPSERALAVFDVVLEILRRGQDAGEHSLAADRRSGGSLLGLIHGMAMLAIDGLLMPEKVGSAPLGCGFEHAGGRAGEPIGMTLLAHRGHPLSRTYPARQGLDRPGSPFEPKLIVLPSSNFLREVRRRGSHMNSSAQWLSGPRASCGFRFRSTSLHFTSRRSSSISRDTIPASRSNST